MSTSRLALFEPISSEHVPTNVESDSPVIRQHANTLHVVYGFALLTRGLKFTEMNELYPLADELRKNSRGRFIVPEDLDSNGLKNKRGSNYNLDTLPTCHRDVASFTAEHNKLP